MLQVTKKFGTSNASTCIERCLRMRQALSYRKHDGFLQQNSSAYDVIAVVDAGSAADPGGH